VRFGIFAIILSFCVVASSPRCSATTLTFDNLASLTSMSTVSPYGGLNWTNWTSYTDSGMSSLNYDGYAKGVVSQPGALFSGGEISSSGNEITGMFSGAGGSTFTLNTAYLGAAYYDGEKLAISGFNGVTPVFSTTVTLITTGAQKFSFEEAGLTSVNMTPVPGTGTDTYGCGTFNCTQFTMDNLEINDPIPTSAPEPASLYLVSLAAVAWMLRKRLVHSLRA